MREIKFRAWDIYYDKFIYGELNGSMQEFWGKVQGGTDAGSCNAIHWPPRQERQGDI